MIPAPRIAVIDDEKDAIDAIQRSLESMDTSCLPVLVTAGKPSTKSSVRGIRLLFLDIHLVSGHQAGAALYDTTASILEQVIAQDNGPYVLVIWTSDKNKRDELVSHISDHYPNIPQPLASLLMAKEEFLGENGFDMPKVAAEIKKLLSDQPQATALLYWENAVDLACGDLIGKLCGFVNRKKMFLGESAKHLERLLTSVAQSAVGLDNVKDNEMKAINDGLTPFLFDRLHHLPGEDGKLKEIWAKAISNPAKRINLDPNEKADLNTMYHSARDTHAPIKPGTRGAVYELSEATMLQLFQGHTSKQILINYLQPKEEVEAKLVELASKYEWRLVGLRAACDEAQPKAGMHRLILAAEILQPIGVNAVGPHKASEAIFPTTEFKFDEKIFKLILNFNYTFALSEKQLSEYKLVTKWRLRENMCAAIEFAFASHASRPGLMKID